MSNDITVKPKLENVGDFGEAIEDVEIIFKTQKGAFIGTFNAWNINLNLNSDNVEIPETIKPLFKMNGKPIKMPTFILKPKSNEETTEELTLKGYDKSILFDEPFEWTQTLPCTIGQLAQNICSKVGVQLKDTNFANSDFIIYRQIADNKRTNRAVIAMIAGAAGGNAFINEDDKLEIRSFIDIDLDIEEYFSSEKFVKIGPITGVNLAREPIKDYKELNDATLSAQYKSCMVKITNNLIVDDNRELALQPIYNKLHGLEFYCKKIETHEAFFTKPFSFVQCNNHKVLVDTICIKYPTLLDSYISSNQLTEVEAIAKNKSLKQRVINTEAKVDEVEGKINLLTSEVSEHEDKIAELEINVNGITQKVENVADLTREVSGTTKIQLDDCMQGELVELHFYGNNTVFERVYPSKKLYPSKTLYPRGFGKIAIYKNISEELIQETLTNVGTAYWKDDNEKKILNLGFWENYNNKRLNYIKVEPNTRYRISINKSELAENESFMIGTYSKEFKEKLDNEELHNFKSNQVITNAYFTDEGIAFDKGITYLEIKTGSEDEYLEIRCNTSSISNIKIYENYQEIELNQLKYGLRQFEDKCDELVLKDNKLQVIRRVGTDTQGNKYILENEKTEDLGELTINLLKGTNYIEILNYVANMKAKYVVLNDITSHFASVAEMKASFALMADSINLTLSKKVNEDEIFAAINMAVLKLKGENVSKEEVEKSIIQLFANILEIDTDNFKLSKNGTATIIKGIIAGLELWKDSYDGIGRSWLTKDFIQDGNVYRSGILIKDSDGYNTDFIFAGMPIVADSWNTGNANLRILHNGEIRAKWFKVNGENGYFYVDYNSGKRALSFTKNGIYWYLDDVGNGNWFSFFKDTNGQWLSLYDAPFLGLYDGVHGQAMLNFYKYNPNSSGNERLGHLAAFFSRIECNGNRADGVNNSIYIQGYEVATNASDRRLKKRIKKSKNGALNIINQIEIDEFDWRKPRHHKRKHIDYGYIAQDTQQVLESLVDYDKLNDKYQMNLLNLSALHTKAIQELSKENQILKQTTESQQKQIDFLINKLNCKEELEEYMKGEK